MKIKQPTTINQQLSTVQRGFTLVEVMISISIFIIAITIGIGAVLNMNSAYRKASSTRSLMDNLSFVMEDMTRNLRLGSEYNCDGNGDCVGGGSSVKFKDMSGQKYIKYYLINKVTKEGVSESNFYEIGKQIIDVATGDEENSIITSSEINLDIDKSGFTVVGVGADNGQPLVIIKLAGKIKIKTDYTNFNLETAVSQRLIE